MSDPKDDSVPIGVRPTRRAPFVEPRTALESEIAGLWAELLGTGPVGVFDDFFALGGTSLSALRMIDEVLDRLGRPLPLTALVAGATVERVAAALARDEWKASPLVPLRVGRGRPPLVCIHPAGGAALCYLHLARALPVEQPVFALAEPPGISDREPSIEERAATYIRDALIALPEGPWCVGGHSFGGLVAFEIARQLAGTSRAPRVVALIDTTAPLVGGVREEEPLVARLAGILERSALDDDLPADPEEEQRMWAALAAFAGESLSGSSPDDTRGRTRLGTIERFCRRHHFLPPAGTIGYVELRKFLRAMRAAFRSARRYAPGPCAGRVVLFQASADSRMSPADTSRWQRVQAARWAALVTERFAACAVPGHHLDLLGPQHAATLAARLATALADDDGVWATAASSSA